jgi:ubiquinone/menaquinone biosynthesis C-methylase UbiE
MRLPRTLEPEVMDTEEEARDYDSMDHADVNARFCDDFLERLPPLGRVLDVGTGTALIPIELCRREPGASVHAIDLASSMLASARRNLERAGLARRVHLEKGDAKCTRWSDGAFDAVISNSLVHHVADVARALREMHRLVRPGGVLFVRDLARPENVDEVLRIVDRYAPLGDSADSIVGAVVQRQRKLFEASLHAALTPDEVIESVVPLGIPRDAVRLTSDRHWTLTHVTGSRH